MWFLCFLVLVIVGVGLILLGFAACHVNSVGILRYNIACVSGCWFGDLTVLIVSLRFTLRFVFMLVCSLVGLVWLIGG